MKKRVIIGVTMNKCVKIDQHKGVQIKVSKIKLKKGALLIITSLRN